jgi:hypothetical protein
LNEQGFEFSKNAKLNLAQYSHKHCVQNDEASTSEGIWSSEKTELYTTYIYFDSQFTCIFKKPTSSHWKKSEIDLIYKIVEYKLKNPETEDIKN